MKFSALVAIVPEDLEQECIDAARDRGAGGITVLAVAASAIPPGKPFSA